MPEVCLSEATCHNTALSTFVRRARENGSLGPRKLKGKVLWECRKKGEKRVDQTSIDNDGWLVPNLMTRGRYDVFPRFVVFSFCLGSRQEVPNWYSRCAVLRVQYSTTVQNYLKRSVCICRLGTSLVHLVRPDKKGPVLLTVWTSSILYCSQSVL